MTCVALAQYRAANHLSVCDFLIALNRKERMHSNRNRARFEVFYQKLGFETDRHFTFYWKE